MFDLDQCLEKQLKDPESKKIHGESQEEHEATRMGTAVRCSQNVIQEEFVRWMEIWQSDVSRTENGAYNPRISALQKIMDALGMKLYIESRKKGF